MIPKLEAATHRAMEPTKAGTPSLFKVDRIGSFWQDGTATVPCSYETDSRQIGILPRAQAVAAPLHTDVFSTVWPAFKRRIAPQSAIHAFCLFLTTSDEEDARQGLLVDRCPLARARGTQKHPRSLEVVRRTETSKSRGTGDLLRENYCFMSLQS